MSKLYGLIPAAGKGTRAKPYSNLIPKGMLEINGVPNLQRTVELMRDQLEISEIVIVIGHLGQHIIDYLGDGEHLGVSIRYVKNTEIDRGLAWSVLLGAEHLDDYFCVILSDECYVDSNHHELKSFDYRRAIATCVLKEVDDKEAIKRNYAAVLEGDVITALIEKPEKVDNDILGCGTWLLSPEITPLLKEAFAKSSNNYVEFVTFLGTLCLGNRPMLPFWLKGSYVNVNDRDSLTTAAFNERSHRFNDQRKSLLIYSEGIEENISFSLERYKRVTELDKLYLIVPHDNVIEATARSRGVEIIRCPPGCELYGEKIRYAFDQVEGDILILTEVDYAFPARDIEKLMAYLKEADMVVGTRTTRKLMQRGNDLQGAVRFANVLVAKIMEVLWWRFEGRFTDVGCTFRAIWRSSYKSIRNDLSTRGPEFSAEMIVAMLNQRKRVIEVPVNYNNVSRALNARYRNMNTLFRFLRMLLVRRLQEIGSYSRK